MMTHRGPLLLVAESLELASAKLELLNAKWATPRLPAATWFLGVRLLN